MKIYPINKFFYDSNENGGRGIIICRLKSAKHKTYVKGFMLDSYEIDLENIMNELLFYQPLNKLP